MKTHTVSGIIGASFVTFSVAWMSMASTTAVAQQPRFQGAPEPAHRIATGYAQDLTGATAELGAHWLELATSAIGDSTSAIDVQAIRAIVDSAKREAALDVVSREVIVLIPDSSFLEALTTWTEVRTSQGFKVTVHDVAAEIGPDADPESIHSFLAERYAGTPRRFLLIIGDHGLIPMLPSMSDTCTPYTYTDLYYADLRGDWDSDGDGLYGEMVDDDVSLYRDLLVGRIPAFTPEEAASVLQRVLTYEAERAPDADEALLAASAFSLEGDTALVQQAVAALLGFSGIETTRMYDTDTFVYEDISIDLDPDYLLDETPVVDVWNQEQQALLYAISHGSSSGLNEIMSSSDIAKLEVDGSYLLAAACSISGKTSGWPANRNFSERLMFEGGAVGIMGATNGVTPGYNYVSGVFAELVLPMVSTYEDVSLGRSLEVFRWLYQLLFIEYAPDDEEAEDIGQNLRSCVLYGDPTSAIRLSAPRSTTLQ